MGTRPTALLLVILGGLLCVGPVQAHADYLRSEPGAGAVVATPPARVEIWFTQDMFRRAGANWIRVTGPDGADAHIGEAVIDDDDRRHLTVALRPDLISGEYTVTWHTLSAEDGDEEEKSFTFTLDPQAAATSTPQSPAATPTAPAPRPEAGPTPTAAPPDSGSCGLGLIPVLGMVGLALRPRRRLRRSACA